MHKVPSLKKGVFLGAVIVASVAAVTAQHKSWAAPRAAWGDPDCDGIWNYGTMTPLEWPASRHDATLDG